jgi:hypothetical protein
MGVKERTKRSAVDRRQFKVERANAQRAERRDTECAESPSPSLRIKGTGGIGDDHR